MFPRMVGKYITLGCPSLATSLSMYLFPRMGRKRDPLKK